MKHRKSTVLLNLFSQFLLVSLILVGVLTITGRISFRSKANVGPRGKYTVAERFGFAFPTQICTDTQQPCVRNLKRFENPDHFRSLQAGWYYDWSDGKGSLGGPFNEYNLTYMPLVGGYNNGFPQSSCQNLKRQVGSNPNKYPDNTLWTVGNEIGWDDNRDPNTYASDFNNWYQCLKSINPTYQVGTGAMLLNFKLPQNSANPQLICVPSTYQAVEGDKTYYSGNTFFKNFISILKNSYHIKPDSVIIHVYTACNPANGQGGYGFGNWARIDLFKEYVKTYRQLMMENGLRDRDMIIKESGPLYGSDIDKVVGRTLNRQEKMNWMVGYMNETIQFLMTETSNETGQIYDGNRLVQKWAWFPFSGFEWVDGPDTYNYMALYDKYTRVKTQLGIRYAQLINYYNKLPTTTPAITITPSGVTIIPSPTIQATATPSQNNQTVELYLVADSYIDSWNPTVNYSKSPFLKVRALQTETIRSSLLKFDISGIVQGSVKSATLILYLDSRSNSNPIDLHISLVNKSWQEGSVNWLQAGDGDPWNGAELDSVGDTVYQIISDNRTVEIDVSELVKYQKENDLNFGFLLTATSEGNVEYNIRSNDYWRQVDRPKLIINQ